MSDLPEQEQTSEALLGEPEPWEPWETKLVGICLLTAIAGLLSLGWLINTYILN